MKFVSALLLGLVLAARVLPAEEPNLERRLESLIVRLSHENFLTREAATKELVSIGRPALPSLEAAVENGPAETRARARSAIKAVFERISWETPWLEVEGKGRSLHAIVGELSSREHVQLCVGDIARVYQPPRPISFDTDFHGSFWSVLDELCEKSNARVEIRGWNGALSLCVVGNRDDSLRHCYVDGIKFVQEHRVRYDRERNRMIIGIDCFGDSSRWLLAGSTVVTLIAATTDTGEELRPSHEDITPRFHRSGFPYLYHHNATVYLSNPHHPCVSLRRLECEIDLQCFAVPETITFEGIGGERVLASSEHFEGEFIAFTEDEQRVKTARAMFSRGDGMFAVFPVATIRRGGIDWQSSVTAEVDRGIDGRSFGVTACYCPSSLAAPESISFSFYRHISRKRFRVVFENIEL